MFKIVGGGKVSYTYLAHMKKMIVIPEEGSGILNFHYNNLKLSPKTSISVAVVRLKKVIFLVLTWNRLCGILILNTYIKIFLYIFVIWFIKVLKN